MKLYTTVYAKWFLDRDLGVIFVKKIGKFSCCVYISYTCTV